MDTSRITPASGMCAEQPSRTLVTTVWFPATSPGGAFIDGSGAPYPLIAYSHGLSAYRTSEEYLARHLASWGYIVSSQDFPLTNLFNIACVCLADIENQAGDVSFVIDSVLAQFGSATDGTRIAAGGLSYGGGTTLLVTYHPQVRDPRIQAALAIASTACWVTKRFFKSADVPLMLLAGTSDQLVPEAQNAGRAYKAGRAPEWLVSLKDASHTGFAGAVAALPGTPHPDSIGCAAIGSIVPDDPDPSDNSFAGLSPASPAWHSSKARSATTSPHAASCTTRSPPSRTRCA